jgi:iron complex outermembrane receptor protein
MQQGALNTNRISIGIGSRAQYGTQKIKKAYYEGIPLTTAVPPLSKIIDMETIGSIEIIKGPIAQLWF